MFADHSQFLVLSPQSSVSVLSLQFQSSVVSRQSQSSVFNRHASREFDDSREREAPQVVGVQDHTKLLVWHRARGLNLLVRTIAPRLRSPDAPKLRAQTMDAVQSIGRNIAEGAGRGSRPDFARFIDMAAASSTEVEHHLTTAHDLGLIADADLARIIDETSQIRRMLFGFRRTLLRREAEEQQRSRTLSTQNRKRRADTDD